MRRMFAVSVLGLAGWLVLGARAQDAGLPAHEAIVKDMLGVLEQITESLKTVNDEPTAAAAKAGLQEAAARWQQIRMKAEAIKPPSRTEKDRLEPYAEKFIAAQKQLFGQISRVIGVPGGRELLKEVRSVLSPEKTKKEEPAKSN